MKKDKWIFLILALSAFLALGLEAVLAFWLEPGLFGTAMSEWSDRQNILHWLFTCALWGCTVIGLIHAAKKYEFNLFERGKRALSWQWIVITVLLICKTQHTEKKRFVNWRYAMLRARRRWPPICSNDLTTA